MIPTLHLESEVDFRTNGLGSLSELFNVDVTEQRNGMFQLTATYPTSGQYYKEIESGRIILAKPSPLDNSHAFRIARTKLDVVSKTIEITAYSITYDLNHNLIKRLKIEGDGQWAMRKIEEATVDRHMFKFYSDISRITSTELNGVSPMEAIAGVEGSFLQRWGGELKRENRRVSMLQRRGRDNVTSFRLGKNIEGLEYEVDTSEIVTQVVPVVSITEKEKTRYVYGDIVKSKHIANYPIIFTQQVDVSEHIKIPDKATDADIKKKIDAYASNWFTKSQNTGKDKPKVTVDIDVLSLQDSADYQDVFKDLETVQLTDTVTVYVPEFKINITAIVNEIHYDPIMERVTNLVVGASKLSFASSNKNLLNDLMSKITQIREDATNAVRSANGKNTNYYGRYPPKHPQEGDLWFWEDGEESGVRQFINGQWVDLVDTQTQKRITLEVDKKIEDAKSFAEELDAKQKEEADKFREETRIQLDKAEKERKELATKGDNLLQEADANAQKIMDNAVSIAKESVTETLNEATAELNRAQKELGDQVKLNSSAIEKTDTELRGKVSQAELNKQTQTLTTKLSEVKATADGVKVDVSNYKKTTDGNIQANKSKIDVIDKAINLKVNKTDYDAKNKSVDNTLSQLKLESNKITQSVAELKLKANSKGQVNQLINTEFNPDLEGWELKSSNGSRAPYRSWLSTELGSATVGFATMNAPEKTYVGFQQVVQIASTPTENRKMSMSWWVETRRKAQYANLWIRFQDSSGTLIMIDNKEGYFKEWSSTTTSGQHRKWEGINVPSNATQVTITFEAREGMNNYLAQPMVVFADKIGDYVAGNYNNNQRVSALEVGVDGITGLVNDPKSGLKAVAKLAADGMSVATTAKADAAKSIQTATGIQSQVTKLNGNVTTLESKQTQTSSQITKEISDRIAGDSSTVTQLKGLLNSEITSVTKGYTSAITQSADALGMTMGALNLVIDSNLSEGRKLWSSYPGWEDKWYVGGSLYKGIRPLTINTSGYTSQYFGVQTAQIPRNGMDNVFIKVDVLFRSSGGAETDQLAVYYDEYNSSGVRIGHNNITGWLGNTSKVGVNSKWTTYAKSIKLNTDTAYGMLLYTARGNVTANISRPYVGTVELTGDQYTPGNTTSESTVLQLFKDNFALGIKDNTGALISGINGDGSGTRIAGNKIILDGNVTITGKAWMDGAVMKNGSIGNAQIANASINSAKISNIDAGKISFGTLDGLKANIININAKNLFGDTGHLWTVNTARILNTKDTTIQIGDYAKLGTGAHRGTLGVVGYDGNTKFSGSIVHWHNPRVETTTGLRLWRNHLMSLRGKDDVGNGNLYLNPYGKAAVCVTLRDDDSAFLPIRASQFAVNSVRSAKTDIQAFEEDALDIVNRTQIRQYTKAGETEIGVIADEADTAILSPDEKGVSLYDYTSVLYKAVQQLTKKVEMLEDERTTFATSD
ncbi:phage tail protein [Weissella ceti]|uniref:Phage tail protein n=1 Tax=Weissella ceti TaxID=759620 RepID=A0ABT3E481_9LACO|nr:phage tail spike protein [Weissella ceti]MCW0953241.1 phage tail protein [Weissella ceti]QVK12757.1 phage tail protein [Weissella ceti]